MTRPARTNKTLSFTSNIKTTPFLRIFYHKIKNERNFIKTKIRKILAGKIIFYIKYYPA